MATNRIIVGLIVGAIATATALPALGTSTDSPLFVILASATALSDRGIDVVDDYGAFVTARLDDAARAALEAHGFSVMPVPTAAGRGGFRSDPLEPPEVTFPAGLDDAGGSDRSIVQFRGPVKAEWRSTLDALATRVYDYLPDNSFLVRLTPEAGDELAKMPEVRAVIPYLPAFKLAPELPGEGPVQATVIADSESDLGQVLDDLVAAGAQPTSFATTEVEHVVDVTLDASMLPAVAAIDAVSWIEPAYDEGSTDNEFASAISQSGTTGTWTAYANGVDGSTQMVSICDTGINTDSLLLATGQRLLRMLHEMHDDTATLDFVEYNRHLSGVPLPLPPHRKVELYYSPQESGNRGDWFDGDGHGTHTGGTIAGDAPGYGVANNHDGVAFASRLLVCDITTGTSFNILNDYANYWGPAYAAGARINSNSWGSTHTNAYTEKARQHDLYVGTHRDFVILRSMGNTGATGLIRPEAVAKSALGIGATDNAPLSAENIASFSTGGLATDGRMKPNVVAPGNCLTSSGMFGANAYTCLAGTSMSTPTTAGAAALVRDYFKKGFYPSGAASAGDALDASSALVRAMLQVSGKEISGDRAQTNFPNKAQGWGRVLLDDALFFGGDSRRLVAVDEATALATGATEATTLTVGAGQALRIMIAWSDVAGAAGANPALVNDLHLSVVGPGGAYVGNHFVGNEVPAGAFAADNRNVEEAVYINAPAAGTYTVTVTGGNVPSGPQTYVLVATGDVTTP